MRLFPELTQRGYTESYALIAAYTRRMRRPQELAPGPDTAVVAEPSYQPLTPRRAIWLVLQREETCTEAEA